MELFSTVLFHLSKEVDLAFLAHEMVDLDWLAPQTWCVIGNSFASQHEHDQAIACFQRAIQLDPQFAYAYSLQGLEHTENEEYDKARQCFMNALRANRRLYHAWYSAGNARLNAVLGTGWDRLNSSPGKIRLQSNALKLPAISIPLTLSSCVALGTYLRTINDKWLTLVSGTSGGLLGCLGGIQTRSRYHAN